jgi:hypothetical protein
MRKARCFFRWRLGVNHNHREQESIVSGNLTWSGITLVAVEASLECEGLLAAQRAVIFNAEFNQHSRILQTPHPMHAASNPIFLHNRTRK